MTIPPLRTLYALCLVFAALLSSPPAETKEAGLPPDVLDVTELPEMPPRTTGTIDVPTITDSGISIRMTPAFQRGAMGRVVPMKIEIENASDSPEQWRFELRASERFINERTTTYVYHFAVPAGQSLQEVIYISLPILDNSYGSWDAQLLASWFGAGVGRSSSLGYLNEVALMMKPDPKSKDLTDKKQIAFERTLSEEDVRRLAAAAKIDLSEKEVNLNFAVNDWPAQPDVYSSQDVIVMPEHTYETALDESRKQALRDWIAAGNVLFLRQTSDSAASDIEPIAQGFIVRSNKLELIAKIMNDGVRAPSPGKEGHAGTANLFPAFSDSELKAYMPNNPNVLLSVALIAFAILVGPVSLKVWAPVGKRHRLFVLIPAISVVFSLFLVVFIVLRDGFGGEGMRKVHVVLLPDSHAAFVAQSQICRTGVVSSHAFPLPQNTRIASRILDLSDFDGSVKLDLAKGAFQRTQFDASGAWFPSRSGLLHNLAAYVPTRARISVLPPKNPSSPPVLQSTFPSTLRDLTYRDAQGKRWHVQELPPGQKVSCQPVPDAKPAHAGSPYPLMLEQGEFDARLDSSENAPWPLPTHPSIRWEQDEIRVTGSVSLAQ